MTEKITTLQEKIISLELQNFYNKIEKFYDYELKSVETTADLINLEQWVDYIKERPIRLYASFNNGALTFEQFIEWIRSKAQSKAWRLWRLNQKEKQTKGEIELLKSYEEECWRTLGLDYLVSNAPTPLEVVNAKYEQQIIKEKWVDLDCLIDYEFTVLDYETTATNKEMIKKSRLRKKAQEIWKELQ